MFASHLLSSFALLFVTVGLGVSATPVELKHFKRTNVINSPNSSNSNSCNVGEAQCCQSIHQSHDQSFQRLTSLLGLVAPADGLLAGVQCSPILNVAGVLSGSSTCHSQPICCTGNE
ncbi:hypothetical protein FRC20_008434 [Serendipita sp. 405]|nr:hypothetical protein FRC20_008434 [Serendipita sp. 405]